MVMTFVMKDGAFLAIGRNWKNKPAQEMGVGELKKTQSGLLRSKVVTLQRNPSLQKNNKAPQKHCVKGHVHWGTKNHVIQIQQAVHPMVPARGIATWVCNFVF
tara:strand:+ start:3564 stop:3872 length:309 start_codon:yes stop_codon:yes gene_type:complete